GPAAGAENPLAGDQVLALEALGDEAEPVIALDEETGLRLDRAVGVELADAEEEHAAGDHEAEHHETEQCVRNFDQPAATAAPVLAVLCHSGSPSPGGEERGG